MSGNGLTISKLALSADVNIETVRYYQRVGLIDQPIKPAQGYRQYSHSTVTRIRFIKRAQRLGFALKDINDLLKLDDGKSTEAKIVVDQLLNKIDTNITELYELKISLNSLINVNELPQTPDKAGQITIVNALMD